MIETIDRRVLGAVSFVDATTGARVVDGLVVASPDATLRRNRSGLWVVWSATGLDSHVTVFDAPPASPPVSSLTAALTVADLSGRYLSRKAAIRLPRDPDPTHASSLFVPMNVNLYRAPGAAVSPRWVVIRASITDAATGAALPGALVRVTRVSSGEVLAHGVSDERGEALIVLSGIPVTTFNAAGGGPPLATEVDITILATFDPGAGPISDPDAVEAQAGLPSASLSRRVSAGQTLVATLAIVIA